MPLPPSIKGSVFRYHVESIRKRLDQGDVSREELSRHLGPEGIALLDSAILPTQWYDIRTYVRLVQARQELDGDFSHESLRRYGAEAAENLLASGLYRQFGEYVDRSTTATASDAAGRFEAFGRELKKMTLLHASLMNFCRVAAKVDPETGDRYIVEYSEAADFPELLCWTTDGFFNRVAGDRGAADLWGWRRPEPDRVVYYMTRPF